MKYLPIVFILAYISLGQAYTKYGRTCQDIGCLSNEVCVMKTDPCNIHHRNGDCGSYPTCARSSNSLRTCTNYVCPPSTVCKMDGSTPKCVNDLGTAGYTGYNTHNGNPGRGETTPRPNSNAAQSGGRGGYTGGSIGSGYPGEAGRGGTIGSGSPDQGGRGGPINSGSEGPGGRGGPIGSGYPGQIGRGETTARPNINRYIRI